MADIDWSKFTPVEKQTDWSQFKPEGPEPEQDGPLTRGFKRAINSGRTAYNLATGDADTGAALAAERADYARKNPGSPEGNELMAAWERGDGVTGGIKEVAGEVAKDWTDAPNVVSAVRATGKNLGAMGGGILEQMPNMVAPMAGMLAGGAAGSLAGPVGTVGGAFAGATAGNTAMEAAEQVDRAIRQAGINPEDKVAVKEYLAANGDTVLGQAATKGAIIGAVDTATMGAGHLLLSAPGKAAAGRALEGMGVDLADRAAVKAAMASDDFASRIATDVAYQTSQKGMPSLARNATVAALEPAGEFAGEYLGQGAATGDWDTKGAALEALSSIGQGAATFAGQKIYEAATSPLRGKEAPPVPSLGDVDQANADLGFAADQYADLVPSEQRLLGSQPSVITVPTQDGGTTEIDRNTGPLSDIAVDVVQGQIQTGMPLRAYASAMDAQTALEQRPDRERVRVAPHPRASGRYAIVPKTAEALTAIDRKAEAQMKSEERLATVESEDGNASQVATTGGQGSGADSGGSAGNSQSVGGVAGGRGDATGTSAPGRGTDTSLGDASVGDAALDELAPAPVQPVSSMPAAERVKAERQAAARAEAQARGAQLTDDEVASANVAPTEAQQAAGNYQKGHVKIGSLDISIENPAGSTRSGKEGKKSWSVKMSDHYGYIKRTEGADGEQVDVYVKSGTATDHNGPVFVVDQYNPKTGQFDEHKAFVGYRTALDVTRAYDAHFSDGTGPKRRKGITKMAPDAFTTWARHGDTSQAADKAQTEIAQSTGKESKKRSNGDLYQAAADANKRRQERRLPTEQNDTLAVREATGADVSVVAEKDLPNADTAEPGQVSKQTAEFARHVAKLFGKRVAFVEGMPADGFYNHGNTIYLSTTGSVHHLRLLGHEMLHALRSQSKETYAKLLEAVRDVVTDAQLTSQFRDYFSQDKGKNDWTDDQITEWLADDKNRDFLTEEWMADLSGNRWTESAFWEDVFTQVDGKYGSEQAKGIIAKLRLALVTALNKLKTLVRGSAFAVDGRVGEQLDQIRAALATGFADYAKAVKDGQVSEGNGETKFSRKETASDHKMLITREERELADKTKLTREELSKVTKYAKQFGLPPKQVETEVRRIKARFPESAGWAPLEFLRVDPKTMAKKATKERPLPADAIFFVEQGYKFHTGDKSTHDQRVKRLGSALAGEITGKYVAAQNGDPVAKVIMRQADWYQALRGKLRSTFGGFGDFLAQLLGPTSANNPVEPNFKYGIEALKMATSGKWDNLFKEVFAWRADIDAAAANLDAVIEKVKAEGGKGVMEDPRVVLAAKELKKASVYKGEHPRRENGKQFGMATKGIEQILAEAWGDKSHGDAPKTKNYYQNIMGRTMEATIDVWAARTLRRLANENVGNFPRIPPVAETSVVGSVLVDNVTSGSEFGFGQEVFREAAEQLRNSGIPQFEKTTPDAVQAMIWFAEKELWARRDWTTKVGEEGSIEHEMLLAGFPDRAQVDAWRVAARAGHPNPDTKAFQGKDGAFRQKAFEKAVARWQEVKQIAAEELAKIERYPDRFVAGVTTEIPNDKPTDSEMSSTARELDAVITGDKVMAKRVIASTGEFMGDFERTLDVEAVVRNGFDANPLWNKLVEIGDREGQQAVFLSRVLREDELGNIDPTKHRPGVELYFAKPRTLAEVQPLMDLINEAGVHGMTMATEGRRTPGALAGKDQPIVGIRMQHIPEFMLGYGYNVSMTNAEISSAVLAARDQMRKLVEQLSARGDVATATAHWYETRVHFYGNTESEGSSRAGSPAVDQRVWSGQRIGEALAGAARFDGDGKAPLAARRAELLAARQVSRRDPAKLSTQRSNAARDERNGGSNARTGEEVRGYGVSQPGSVSVQGIHYSKQERSSLDGRYYGTGARGAEGPRVRTAEDARLKERVYFYVNKETGIRPEDGVGSIAHAAQLNNVYDANADTWVQTKVDRALSGDAWLNAFESAVIDNGFDGYVTDFGTQRAAVLLGRHNVPVTRGQGAVSETKQARRTDLPMGKMTGAEWKKLEPRATELEDDKSYYRDQVRFSPERFDKIAEHFTKRVSTALSAARVTNPVLINGNTPASMQILGWADRKLMVEPGELQKIASKPGFETDKKIGDLVYDLARPGAMFWNEKQGSLNILRREDMRGSPALIAIRPDVVMEQKRSHLMVTAHRLDNQESLLRKITSGELKPLYLDKANPLIKRAMQTRKYRVVQAVEHLAPENRHARDSVQLGMSSRLLSESDLVKWEQDNWGDAPKFSPARAQTETPEFKRWYEGSNLRNADGSPRVLYHGTNKDFSRFGISKIGAMGPGVYLGDDPEVANAYADGTGANVMPVYARGRYLDNREWSSYVRDHGWEKGREKAIEDGAAGVWDQKFESAVLVFDPANIKSAIGNNGQFDGSNPDIRYSPARWYFSPLQRAFEQAPDKMFSTAPQVKAWLSSNASRLGVKQDEIQWSGINDWLDLQGKQKISKDQVVQYLANNGVQIEEVEKGVAGYDEDNPSLPDNYFVADVDEYIAEENPQTKWFSKVVMDESGGVYGLGNSEDEAISDAHSGHPELWEKEGATQYGQYTLPGGENYRELLLTLPEKYTYPNTPVLTADENRRFSELTQKMRRDGNLPAAEMADWKALKRQRDQYNNELEDISRADGNKNPFRSSHWQEDNILAHVRFNDRTDADGKRVLFIEELQSDWGQKGKKAGFEPKLRDGWRIQSYENETPVTHHVFGPGMSSPYGVARSMEEAKKIADTYGGLTSDIAPKGPFVTDTKAWTGLAVKRMIAYAAENGYDKVAFVNGEQSVDRYSLAKKISRLEWKTSDGSDSGVLIGWNTSGNGVLEKDMAASEVEDHIGKELADRLINGPVHHETVRGRQVRRIDGADLKVGGEGMKAFYDKIVPQAVNDVLKKLGGGKVETVQIEGEFTDAQKRKFNDAYAKGTREDIAAAKAMQKPWLDQTGFTITPAMREQVSRGLPLFSPARAQIDVDGVSRSTRNSAGKPIAQTEEGLRNFWRWFGDSKVVDAEGKPLVVYHGTDKKFTKINFKKGAQGLFWFTSDKSAIENGDVGASGKGVVMDLYAKIDNPANWKQYDQLMLGEFKSRGLDGAILPESDGTFVGFVIDKPTQIKSATGNRGTFDVANPDIRYSLVRKVSDAVTSTIGKLDAAVDGLSNLPDQFDYLSDRYLALGKIARVDEISSEVRKSFDGAAPADKQAVYDYLTTRGATTGRISDHKLRSVAKRIKDTINYTGDQLVARGLLDQEARDHYRDQYLPRMYLRHMLDDQAFKVIGMGKKPSDMGYLKHRKDIPQEIRDVVLGEIKDPSFLSVNAIGRAMRDVSLLDWMGKIAQNNEWVFPEIFVPWQGKNVTAYWLRAEADRIENQMTHYTPQDKAKAEALVAQMRSTAHQTLGSMSAIDHKKFKQIPDTRRYGLLRGMWVRNEIYNDIMGASQIVNADPTWFEDWFGFGGKGTQLTQWWKFTKVAANPPGQIRNFISNMVMLQLSGIGLHRLPFALIEAARDITSNGKYWQVAKKYGVTESTFTAQELFRVKRDLVEMEAQKGKLSSLRWLMSAGARFMEGVSDLYQFSEALGKTIKIMEEMKAGKSEAEAAIEAQKWLFDYSLVPQSVRIARNAPVGMPFLTYQIKVLPRLLEVAAKHPWRFLPWAGLLYGMQAAVASMFGVDDDELKKLKKSLPEWLQDRGHTVFLPFHDADGRLQVADVGYFFPWTFYSQIGKHASEGKIKKALVDDIGGQFSAPIVGAGAALMSNYDTFTKQPIYKETDPVGYQAAAIANYAYDLMAPPFISSHGVVSPMGLVDTKFGGKLTQALAGTTNRFGDPKATEEQALGAMLGFNFYGMDPEHTRVTNLKVMEYKIHEAEKSLKQRLMDKGLTQEQRTTAVRDYRERMNELQQEMVEYAKESQVPEQLKAKKR